MRIKARALILRDWTHIQPRLQFSLRGVANSWTQLKFPKRKIWNKMKFEWISAPGPSPMMAAAAWWAQVSGGGEQLAAALRERF